MCPSMTFLKCWLSLGLLLCDCSGFFDLLSKTACGCGGCLRGAFLKALNASGSIHKLLLAGEKRMASAANFNGNILGR